MQTILIIIRTMKLLLATFISLIGFFLIYTVWKRKDLKASYRVLSFIAGWALVLASIFIMLNTYGSEYGLIYSLFGFSGIPFCIASLNVDNRNTNRTAAKQTQQISLRFRKTALNILNFLVIIPVCFIFSLLSTLLISQTLAWQTVNQLALVVVIFPLVWAVSVYAYLYSETRKTAAIKLFSLILVSALLTSL